MNAIEHLLGLPHSQANSPFLIDASNGHEITYREVDAIARSIGADLSRRGIEKGDRVALVLHNSVSCACLYLGCLYAGVVTVPINPVFSSSEVKHILSSCRARLLIAESETQELIPSDIDIEQLLMSDESGPADEAEYWRPLNLPVAEDFKPFDGIADEDTMTVVFTSGTTAAPSGVEHRISDMIDNARLFADLMGIGPDNRFYNILSMSYLGGYYNLLILPYCAGASVVLANAFDTRTALRFWKPAIKYKVNTLWVVPSIIAILMELDRGEEGEKYCREMIALGLVGTAPLPLALRQSFEERYGVTLFENYGLSETFFITTNAPGYQVIDGSVGRVLPGVEVSIRGDDEGNLNTGEEGEIFVRTPFLMRAEMSEEYTEPKEYSRDVFFPTGDIGKQLPTGELFITGRKKDLIIRGGINISPVAIEQIIYRHPSVRECAVVGVPDRISGEEIVAVVRLAEDISLDQVRDQLAQACKNQLGSIKVPAHVLELDNFPKSSSGKIKKNNIRELVKLRLGLEEVEERKPGTKISPASVLMVPGRVRKTINRAPIETVKLLSEYPTGIISDCLNRLNAMDAGIHPLFKGPSFCGTAVTVEEVEAGNLMSHIALELLMPGDVLVIDAKGTQTRSCFGGLQATMAKRKGCVAVVVNGTIRDVDDFVELEMPVFGRGVSPGGPLKGWGGNVNIPIACGGVVVSPGDIIVGDNDGVVVVPRKLADDLPAICLARQKAEEKWFDEVAEGKATLDAVGLREAVSNKTIKYE